jgi:hypothetical protein
MHIIKAKTPDTPKECYSGITKGNYWFNDDKEFETCIKHYITISEFQKQYGIKLNTYTSENIFVIDIDAYSAVELLVKASEELGCNLFNSFVEYTDNSVKRHIYFKCLVPVRFYKLHTPKHKSDSSRYYMNSLNFSNSEIDLFTNNVPESQQVIFLKNKCKGRMKYIPIEVVEQLIVILTANEAKYKDGKDYIPADYKPTSQLFNDCATLDQVTELLPNINSNQDILNFKIHCSRFFVDNTERSKYYFSELKKLKGLGTITDTVYRQNTQDYRNHRIRCKYKGSVDRKEYMVNYQAKYNDKRDVKRRVQTVLRNYDLLYDNNTFNKLFEAGLLNETKFTSGTIEQFMQEFKRK